MPLAAFHEPALKHASIALASLHERFGKGDRSILKSNQDVAEGGFALQQYNKAIRCLITPRGGNQKPALDTSLVACVLFACFEVRETIFTSVLVGANSQQTLRGHHGSALSHIHSGTQILAQMNDRERELGRIDSPQQMCVPLETLVVLFTRLDHQKVQVSSHVGAGARPENIYTNFIRACY